MNTKNYNRIDSGSDALSDLGITPEEILGGRNKILEIVDNEDVAPEEKWGVVNIEAWKEAILDTISEEERLELEEYDDALYYLDFLEASSKNVAKKLHLSDEELESCKDISAGEQYKNNFYMYFVEGDALNKIATNKKDAFDTFVTKFPELSGELFYYVRLLGEIKPMMDYYTKLYFSAGDEKSLEFFLERTHVTVLREVIWVELNELLKAAEPKLLALGFTNGELF